MAAITADCCQYAHALLGLFQGASDAELLARESHELLGPVLSAFIQLAPAPKDTPLDYAMPKLRPFFFKLPYLPQPPTQVLQAFMKLVHHSTKLDAWPEVKTAFWLTIASTMLFGKRKHVVKELIPLPAFPHFVICYGRPRAGAWACVDASLGDAICDVMTAGSAVSPTATLSRLELSLGYEQSTVNRMPEQMELIEDVLERLLRSPSLQDRITSLDFSGTIMAGSLLTVAARIVDKCRGGIYQIKQVTFDGVIPVYGLPGYEPGEVPRDFHALSSGAFRLDTSPRILSLQQAQRVSARGAVAPSGLRSVSLSGNYLTPNSFPVHFSALRYGCALEEDLTEYLIESSHAHSDINNNSWRWLRLGCSTLVRRVSPRRSSYARSGS